MRILWADDQRDVVQSLSELLRPLGAKVAIVTSGEEALAALQNSVYDLLILDLLMPPDKWGGLWLLSQIQRLRIAIPSLVMSGEGSQHETIQALRLGAADYVLKEQAKEELLERCNQILHQANRQLIECAPLKLPAPLGIPFSRIVKEVNPVLKLKRIVEYVEAALRFDCIIGISEFSRLFPKDICSCGDLHRVISKPLMGDWNYVRHSLRKKLPSSSIFFKVDRTFDNKLVDQVIEIRNEFAHMSAPSAKKANALNEEIVDKLNTHVTSLVRCTSLKLIIILSIKFNDSKFSFDCLDIRGDNPSFPLISLTNDIALATEKVHFWDDTNDPPAFVNLYPFVVVEPSSEPHSWRLLLFDGIYSSSRNRPLSGEEPIKYIDVWAAEREVNRDHNVSAKHLPKCMTGSKEYDPWLISHSSDL